MVTSVHVWEPRKERAQNTHNFWLKHECFLFFCVCHNGTIPLPREASAPCIWVDTKEGGPIVGGQAWVERLSTQSPWPGDETKIHFLTGCKN